MSSFSRRNQEKTRKKHVAMLSQSSKFFIHSHTKDSTTGTLLPKPRKPATKEQVLALRKEPNHTRKSWNEKTQNSSYTQLGPKRTKKKKNFFVAGTSEFIF